MSNAASTPEFKKILKDIYDSGQAQNSGDALRMAWAEYRQKHHGGIVTVQQRRYAERKSFENPKREDRFGVFVWRGDGQYSKSDSLKNFYSEKLAQKFSDKYPEKNLVVRILRLISRNPKEMRPRIQVSKRQRRGKLRAKSPLKGFRINSKKRLCGSYVDSKTGEPCRLPYDTCLHQRGIKGTKAYKKFHSKKNPIVIYNPKGGTKLPAKNIEIRYQRSGGRHAGQWFRHPFKGSVSLIGLPNGSVLIKSNSGKKLWGLV